MNRLSVRQSQFFLDAEPFRILSGAVHYFRVVPEYWEDRLRKLKAAGLNTVETYIPWNLHEPQKGVFNFTGIADVEKFIQLAGSLELLVIVRPSPYICAEWEAGGLPAWLLQDSSMKIRCNYEPYLAHVRSYYHELLPRLAPLQSTAGGPIIAMQLENEYGSFGNDTCYLQQLKAMMEAEGINVLLCTSDGPTPLMLSGGTVNGVVPFVNFGSKPKEAFAVLRERCPESPPMVMEFWNGWFDHWGEEHHTQPSRTVYDTFEEMLRLGASVNFYMFHGGTNFGFYNGANFSTQYEPTVTSYDYDCPLTEWGEITAKFSAIRSLITQYVGHVDAPLPPPIPRIEVGELSQPSRIGIFDALPFFSTPIRSAAPLTMEQAGQSYGFILYRTTLKERGQPSALTIKGLRDRAQVFFSPNHTSLDSIASETGCPERSSPGNASPDSTSSVRTSLEHPSSDNAHSHAGKEGTRHSLGTLYRNDTAMEPITIPAESGMLEILVENMGRINYGSEMFDAKGITQGVYLDYQCVFDWHVFPLPLETLQPLTVPFSRIPQSNEPPTKPTGTGNTSDTSSHTADSPAFYRFTFTLEQTGDTFIDMHGWTKGIVFVNDFNIGRYWHIGPQKRLYIPAPLLRRGENTITVFELHGTAQQTVYLSAAPDLGNDYHPF